MIKKKRCDRLIKSREEIQRNEEKIKLLKIKIGEAGSIDNFAKLKGLSSAQVSHMYHGMTRIRDDILK